MAALRKLLTACVGCAALGNSTLCGAGGTAPTEADSSVGGLVSGTLNLLHDGSSRIEALFAARWLPRRGSKPDWLLEQTAAQACNQVISTTDVLQLVVQRDRTDGADMLTLRYPLVAVGDVTTYAGAGINQATYYADSPDPGPTMLTGRNRHRSTGAAAEFGAQMHLSGQLLLNANMRWVDINPQADLLRAGDGLVAADPISLGVSLGWRFR